MRPGCAQTIVARYFRLVSCLLRNCRYLRSAVVRESLLRHVLLLLLQLRGLRSLALFCFFLFLVVPDCGRHVQYHQWRLLLGISVLSQFCACLYSCCFSVAFTRNGSVSIAPFMRAVVRLLGTVVPSVDAHHRACYFRPAILRRSTRKSLLRDFARFYLLPGGKWEQGLPFGLKER